MRNTIDLHLLRKLKVTTHQGLSSVFHTSLYSRILIGKHWFLLYYWNHWSKLAIRRASVLTLSPRQQHLLSWFALPDEHYHCGMKTEQMQPYIYTRALSPFKATLLILLSVCLLHSCATDWAENKTPFQPTCTFLKSYLTRTTVASLTSHSKPKGKGCLQWPQRRDLPAIRQLSGEFNIQDRGEIFHGLQQFKNCFWLYYDKLPAHSPLELLPLRWKATESMRWLNPQLTLTNKSCPIS